MKTVLVTGGGGFVGSALVARLTEMGCQVAIAARNRYPLLEQQGVTGFIGDIAEPDFCRHICKKMDTVFHTAAKAGIWGSWRDYERTNLQGTRNIINGCRQAGVKRLVYTSTPSVVFARSDIRGGDETMVYPSTFLCHYARSKALAEQLVLHCNSEQLKTCAIRPHLIWGPGDPHLVPRLIERGRRRLLKIVGDGNNLVDISYIDNVVHAHLLAAQRLKRGDKAAGQAYFIGQERPVRLWDWINELFQELDIAPVQKRVSRRTAYWAGAVLEGCYLLLSRRSEPRMTRFLAEQLARSHYFSHAKAERELGYRPIISLEEGHQRLLAWLRNP